MTALPPRERLVQVVESAARHLPGQLGPLLATERFADGVATIGRLAAADAVAGAVAPLPAGEATRIAEALLQRWAAVAEVRLDPAVAIIGPAVVLAPPPEPVRYEVATAGVEDGWTVEWSGDVTPDRDGRLATLRVDPPEDHAELAARLLVRVFARAGGRRLVLVADRTVRVLSPPDDRRTGGHGAAP